MRGEAEGMPERSRLEAAMAGLDPWSRRLMQLWIEGKSHPEMATALGITEEELLAALTTSVQRLQERISVASSPPPGCQ